MLNLDKSTWTTYRFGSVVKNTNENLKDAAAAGIHRVIALEHLTPGLITINRYGSVEDGTTFTRRVRPGQTLFGKRRAYQRKAAYAEVDAICSGDILVFEADPAALSPRLLPFIVHSDAFYDHAVGTSAGSLSPRTSWKALADFEIELPPVGEQERLADLLWAIENTARTAAGLGTRLSELRTRTLRTCPATITPLGALAAVAQGRALPKAVQGQRSGSVPWYKIADMGADANVFGYVTAETLMAEQEILELGGRIVPAGSVVFPRVGAAVLTERKRLVLQPGAMDENHLILLPNSATSPEVLWAIMDQLSLGDLVQRGVVPSLNMKMIRNTKVRWPNPDSMLWVAELVRKTIAAERAASEELSALRVLRRALLNEIFGGEA